jgi:hypothetical protein
LFNTEFYDNWLNGLSYRNLLSVQSPTLSGGFYIFSTQNNDVTQLSQGITMASITDLFFSTNGASPTMSVGDHVYLISTNSFDYQSVTILSITGDTIYFDNAWTLGGSGPDYALIDPARTNGQWSVISNAAGTDFWWCQLTATSTSISGAGVVTINWRVDRYFQRGTTTIYVTNGVSPPFVAGAALLIAPIPCQYRTFFDLNTPTKDKQAVEFWTTADGISSHAGVSVPSYVGRFYQEFDEESTAARTFSFNQTKRTPISPSVDSNVWLTKTGMPSSSLKQWGIEVSQIGFGAFRIFNYTLKVKPN